MATRSKQKYTAQEKREAIALAVELGPAEAGRRLGIPHGTLRCWGHKARMAAAEGDSWPPAPEASSDEVENDTSDGDIIKEPAESKSLGSKPSKRRVARVYTPSQRLEALEIADLVGVSAAARQLSISRFSIQEWHRKEKLAAAGKGESPTSGPDPADIEARRDHEILTMWRMHPGLGRA